MRGWGLAAALVTTALLLAPHPASASAALVVKGQALVDPYGRVVKLHGVNVAGNSKTPPFIPFTDPAVWAPLRQGGLNTVRLLFNWEAFEPNPGEYQEDYLKWLQQSARAAWENGLYVVIDFHQDAFSRHVLDGCGEGFPSWAVAAGATLAKPTNDLGCQSWALKATFDWLTHGSMAKSFDAFYDDPAHLVRGRYLTLMGRLTAAFKDNPGVIGYDILNEPWGDEAEQLSPLYEDAATAIHRVDQSALIFFEPVGLVGSGLKQTKLSAPHFSNAVYSPHYYDVVAMVLNHWDGSFGHMERTLARHQQMADAWGVPVFLGEFGVTPGMGKSAEFMAEVLRRLDLAGFSWAQWVYTPKWTPKDFDGWDGENFSIVDDTGKWRSNFYPRPSLLKCAGTGCGAAVDGDAKGRVSRFVALWTAQTVGQESELYLPHGLVVDNSMLPKLNGVSCKYDAAQLYLTCVNDRVGPVEVRYESITGVQR